MIIGWAEATTQGPAADLCIVGGGAAGLTMAHALKDSGLSILSIGMGFLLILGRVFPPQWE